MTEYGLSLGTNKGDRTGHLCRARDEIAKLAELKILAIAPIYETEPVDVSAAFADDKFLNTVLIVESPLLPAALNESLHRLESELGRVRGPDRNAPRVIDIDIIYAGDASIEEADLRVPHPRWSERRFVAQPLADVRPDLRLPGETMTVRELAAAMPTTPDVSLLKTSW